MKAFLNRFNRGKDKEREKEKDKDTSSVLEKGGGLGLSLPPLPEWPPQSSSTPSSIASCKPLPDISARPLPPIDEPDPDNPEPSPPKNTSGSSSSEQQQQQQPLKKVAFLSPPPTPLIPATTLPATPEESPAPTPTPTTTTPPLKTSVSRFQATHGKDTPRGSTSTAASSSRTDVASTKATSTPTSSARATSTRTAPSPYPASLRSGTPYSQLSNASSRILAVTSWSEGAEEDLVSNLGPRERTRQEVLWEIVASEERYVADLQRMKDTFIEPLLHPYATPAAPDPDDYSRFESTQDSIDVLPIAARFMSSPPPPTAPDAESIAAHTDDEDELDDQMRPLEKEKTKLNHPRSPYRTAPAKSHDAVPFPSRSHQSIARASSHSVAIDRDRDRADSAKTPAPSSRVLRKFKRSQTKADALLNGAVAPHQLPEDLRTCLEVIESGVLDGHVKLSEGLRKRYDEQYPLVRSLADVFVSNSHIFQGYATYVLHLERALEQVDNALSTISAAKKPKNQDSADWLRVCKSLQRLEESAADKGETGLAISLSKPFQRLLKYPLLFQNLLFHTDPSTFEYEATLQMVAEVETIVRSIEDEKIQKEDRDKTRDVFARIEGLDKVKQLAIPKPSRLLVEERQILAAGSAGTGTGKGSTPPPVMAAKNVKGKTSFRRLSDVLGSGTGVGGKKDLWLVVFNDVVLRCQRTGTTSLPLVSASAGNARTNSLPELQGKSKYATTGRRNSHTRPRNMYKFVKIETWAMDNVQPKEGVVSMEDVVRSKQEARSQSQPKIVPLPSDDEEAAESDDSDKKSKMSFSYWGADKVTLQKPILKPKSHPHPHHANTHPHPARRVSPGTSGGTSAYARESSANAKFGTRLVDQASPSLRPASRRTQGTPSTRTRTAPSERTNDDAHSVKATVTRPAWDAGTRRGGGGGGGNGSGGNGGGGNGGVTKRARQTSQTSAATRVTATTTPVSPAASEDSGVGLVRQLAAQDP
ncbi:Dbl domain-containing protein [Hygrophoropsis aurantiaca]|uniref:Dbl domain-containing protein n=1 Tax=Hygrophoropsis aurantiaca TaxID=72124 RepID=A0ACB8APQ4_9AGAM|nr:Dbl domain-containing protein [Hygrophoropsis aurantiaca]